MSMRRVIVFGLPSTLVTILASVFFLSSDVYGNHVATYTPNIAGARDFAQDFCPDVSYPEDKIADVMWLTAPGGGNSVDVIEGGNQNVPITINFYTTFCANWPQGYNNGATDMQAWNGGVNRLTSGPGAIAYGPKTTGFGARSEWGIGQYGGTLNVANLGTGDHEFCTYFRTTTDRPGTTFIVSPNLCFIIRVNRIIPWTTSADSKVGVDFTPPNVDNWPTARPNQMLYWRHTISAAGGTTPGLGFAIGKSGFFGTNVWGTGLTANHNEPTGTTSAIGAGSSYSVGWGANRPEYATYRVVPSDGGRTLCQSISWGPTAWNNAAWSASAPACVTVPFNYNLTPSVTGPSGVGTVGSAIPTVTPRVNNALLGNAGATTDSPSVEWQLRRIEVAPTGSIPMTQQDNGSLPCVNYGNHPVCDLKGSGNRTFPAGSTTLAALNGETINANTPVGTRICYTLSVQPYSQTNGNWRHSAPVCIKVSKQPKMQVWGHDVRTRGNIETGTTSVGSGASERLFGSWVEYGGFAAAGISGFASGSGLNGGNASTDSTDPSNVWNKLTFANIDNSGNTNYGRFALPANLPTITDQFIGSTSGSFSGGSLSGLASGTYDAGSGSVTIDASTVGQQGAVGKTIIIVSSGTVRIAGNIVYEGNGASQVFTDVRQIPQVIIIARAINIAGTVSQIDSWLLTTSPAGMINTCSDVPLNASLNSNVCSTVLTVNGPVVTQHLHLRRTGGSNTVATSGDPAEIFNLRPDAYVWAYGRASQSGKAQTVYSVELPPRF